MALKIKYLDLKIDSTKNLALFLGKEAGISDIKGIFDDRINQNLLKFIKKIKR